MPDWAINILVVLIPLSVIIPLLIFWAIDRHRENELRKLKDTGRKVKATVVGFRQEPLYRYPGLSSGAYNTVMIRILAEAVIEGKRFKFESERIDQSKCELEKEDGVTVLVMKENPNQYYFDPYQEDY